MYACASQELIVLVAPDAIFRRYLLSFGQSWGRGESKGTPSILILAFQEF